jgi:iron complex transport system ATP-binding protein
MSAAVATERLSHAFGSRPVLKEISFAIEAGEFFVIIGPNGSGKTTLLKLIAGILKPRQGEVRILGREVRSFAHRALARTVAYVPQGLEMNFPFTVQETVLLGRAPHQRLLGIPSAADLAAARRAMAFTGVEALAGRTFDQLSGGEQQRVSIARALCQEPGIILLDEPTAALDLSHQLRLMDLMERLRKEKAVTVAMVSHDVNLAALYADRLLLLADGEIAHQGPPAEVLTVPRLEAAYGCRLMVDESPFGRRPRVTLVPERFHES